MGQAVVDLPDPMEKPPAAGASADDLLSQLAGDEIDRLLGEADAAAPSTEAEAPAASPEPVAMATLLDDAASVTEASAQAPEASGPLDQTIAAEAPNRLAEPPPPPEAPAVAEPVEAVAEATLPAPAAAEAREDRDALLTGDVDDSAPASLPLILRPLEWFSAPLDALSPSMRDFLGKAAIVTLVNSAAVIAYVIWFRK